MLTLNIIPQTRQAPIIPQTIQPPLVPVEFNGLPVVRAPKDLGRRGLTNKNIIIHPSGIKLSKCPNGYIILCSEEDCGNIVIYTLFVTNYIMVNSDEPATIL